MLILVKNTLKFLEEVLLGIRWNQKIFFRVFVSNYKMKTMKWCHSTDRALVSDYQSKNIN